ncbi:MAG: hypothetical protein P1U56_15855, partial [Saprospiraceae bacterium]|nr:hypothetical protein [Saprospiraceae bacterium]
PPNPINLTVPAFQPPWAGSPQGPLVAPGKYSVELFVMHNGKLESQGEMQSFQVKPVHNTDKDYEEVAAFQKKTSDLSRQTSSAGRRLSEARNKLRHIKAALIKTPQASPEMFEQWTKLQTDLAELRTALQGDRIRQSKDESTSPSITNRIGSVIWGHWNTTELPTKTQIQNIELAQSEFEKYKTQETSFFYELALYVHEITDAGAPYTPGR